MRKKNQFIFDDEKSLLSFLKKESESSLLAELCGIIGIDENKKFIFKMMQNRSKNPDQYFSIDPYEYLHFIKSFKTLSIFHSHLIGSEEPSDFDMKTSENCCLSFLIYSVTTEKFFIFEPQNKDYDVNIIERLKESIND